MSPHPLAYLARWQWVRRYLAQVNAASARPPSRFDVLMPHRVYRLHYEFIHGKMP